MTHIHLEKPGIRGLSIAESFKPNDMSSRLAGVVMRRDLVIDGFVFGVCTVKGNDSTDAMLEMYDKLCRDDIGFILISGMIISLFNVVDIDKIHLSTRIPVIGLTYGDSPGLEDAIMRHFPNDYQKKLDQYNKLGKRIPVKLHTGCCVYIRVAGCPIAEAERLLNHLTLQGSVPEPLRVARLLASQNLSQFKLPRSAE